MKSKIIAFSINILPLTFLLSELKKIHPKDTVIFSDMDSTILFQTKNGFPEEQKSAITNFLDRGGTLILVTGDSQQIAEKVFFQPLNYQGQATIYLISGSGFQLTKYQGNKVTELFKTKEIKYNVREKLLTRLETLLKEYFKSPVNLMISKDQFLSQEGFIDELNQKKYGILFNTQPITASFRFEVRPNKITLALDGRDEKSLQEYSLFRNQLINLILNDKIINDLVTKNKLHLFASDHYLDIIHSRKEEGLATFYNLKEAKNLKLEEKHLITLGDSANDKGLLCFSYPTNKPIWRIFVGNKDNLFEEFKKNNKDFNFFYLKNLFIKGTEFVLKSIGKDN